MFRSLLVAGLLIASGGLVAASQQSTSKPSTQKPATPPAPTAPAPVPAAPAPPQPAAPTTPAVPAIPATPTGPPAARTFTSGCGFLMHPVRPEKVADFERFLDYVRDALAKTTNPRMKSQATGWRFFKATEPGPNGVALYVFWVDPAVPGAEYSLGPILAEVYTDPAQLAEIWAFYTTSVTSGGTLLNLSPVTLNPPKPILAPPANAPAAAGQKPGAPAAAAPAPAAPATAPAAQTTTPRC